MQRIKIVNIRFKIFLLLSLFLLLGEISCSRFSGNVYPLPSVYHTWQEVQTEMDSLAVLHPDTVTLIKLGTTVQARNDISVLRIRKKEGTVPVLIVGQHHGDEVMGVEIALDFAQFLVKPSANASDLLERYTFWIVPTLNPDALEIVTSGLYEWKRKNNTDSNNNGKLDLKTDGVDLNRNYPVFWESDVSVVPSEQYYKGPYPASEHEVQALIDLAEKVRFQYAFFYHSSVSGRFNETVYLPWFDPQNKADKADFASMRKLAQLYAENVPKDYEPGTYSVFSGNSSQVGNARNYFYHTWGTSCLTIEVCGVNKFGRGIEHPKAAQRKTIVEKNRKALASTLIQQTLFDKNKEY